MILLIDKNEEEQTDSAVKPIQCLIMNSESYRLAFHISQPYSPLSIHTRLNDTQLTPTHYPQLSTHCAAFVCSIPLHYIGRIRSLQHCLIL